MRLFWIAGIVIIALALTLPAYAETQSVKVSGELTVRGIYRHDFDLNQNSRPDTEDFIMSTTEIQVDADLTDNVSTVVRIVNQRNWGDADRKQLDYDAAGMAHQYLNMGSSLLDLGVDLAYIEIKELFFQPVSIKIGRQDLWFGRGLIIGANQVDPGFIDALLLGDVQDSRWGIGSPELTAFNSFDAVRATIDFEQYAPFVVDLVFFRNKEGRHDAGGETDVYGVNMGYTWDVYNAEAEAYYWVQDDNSIGNPFTGDDSVTHTIGIRGSFMPTDEFTFGGEAAAQFGSYIEGPGQAAERNREAYLFNAFVEYLGWTKYMYSPKVGFEWLFTSGDDEVDQFGGEYSGWNPMYRGYYPLLIRPFQGYYYITDRFPGGEDLGLTNQHEFILSGSIEPLDDITIEAKLAKYYFHRIPVRRNEPTARGGHDVGTELDILTTYDYTEDVTFSLLSAWFFPGEVYDLQSKNSSTAYPLTSNADLQPGVASEVIGSCKVSF